MSEHKALKKALRRQLAEADRKFSLTARAEASRQICDRLRQQPCWTKARSVLFFWPMPEEPDILPLLPEALSAGKVVALPRFFADEGAYGACHIQNHTTQVKPGYYGIVEPVDNCPRVELKTLDFFLVPGVGFSPNGGRLGRGKGYYDRLLAEALGFKCGVAFDWQVTGAIPLESHDIRLNCILTPTRWLEVTSP